MSQPQRGQATYLEDKPQEFCSALLPVAGRRASPGHFRADAPFSPCSACTMGIGAVEPQVDDTSIPSESLHQSRNHLRSLEGITLQ